MTAIVQVFIRNCSNKDREDIRKICYKTGYMGEDLTGKELFNDQKLFGYLFCLYYLMYELQHCFVAENTEIGRVVGYVIGTDDSEKQYSQFRKKMIPRIVLRVLMVSWWKYPESFRMIRHLQKLEEGSTETISIEKDYPAHLHINVLSDYQGIGVGSRLLEKFEQHMEDLKVPGIHLGTSSKNVKAIPFYRKHGYKVIHEQEGAMWPGETGVKGLIFAKKLKN
ncbi:MAG: GNAT family N-acetyltransferase [Candidatus Odinarchaeota archaeon]